ncbi:sigma-70 family RNA polymerase sigma factor [Streptomyces sp. NPDC059009]|uniref:sigma-70 family RNA polymerase sigma factor n=1 Tax=Streptomyces sp. NPDC059009 TaxID=3346694 RepID=UPI00367AD19E
MGSRHGQERLAERFEEHRGHLRAVAYRMLGSLAEADDAVQEAWLRLARAAGSGDAPIENLGGWLRTVVSRICLDVLRSPRSQRVDLVGQQVPDEPMPPGAPGSGGTPEEEALTAESVGRALLVVLDTLTPPERVAFVLHDLFAVPFAEIAPIVDRSPVTTKKLASRARGRVQGTPAVPPADLEAHREVVEAFLAAARGGDLTALLTILAPDVIRRADPTTLPAGAAPVVRGADEVARETVLLRRNARFAAAALVDGRPGIVVAPYGRLLIALRVTVAEGRVAEYEVIADQVRLAGLELAVLDRSVLDRSA